MPDTPESWDDVGCLRLQVDCFSQSLEDVRLDVSELQKLKSQIVLIREDDQQRKKENCQLKVCVITSAVLFGCVLCLIGCAVALYVFTTHPGSAPRWIPRPSDEAWNAHLDNSNAVEETMPVAVAQANHDKTTGIPSSHQLKQQSESDAFATLLHEADHIDRRVEEPKLALELEVRRSQHRQPSTNTGGRIQRAAKTLEEDSKDATESSSESKNMVDVDAAGSRSLAVGEKREAIKETQDEPSSPVDPDMRALPGLPFQMLSWGHSEASEEVLKQAQHGLFWVCFPPSILEQNVKRYAPVFNEVAHSQKWQTHPFVYLDTRSLNFYHEHFCDDMEKTTFVMQKASDAISNNKHASSQQGRIPNDFSVEWFVPTGANPQWFRREFRPDQVIHASLVEEFLNDVHSGKLLEIIPAKGDL